MIDEQETRLQFGYYSESLSRGSNKKVYAICDECGNTRIMTFNRYSKTKGRCKSCAKSGKNNHNYGKHPTEETKDKMSKAHIDKHHTEETKCKMSKNHVDVSGENHPMYGRHHTEETKQKMSKAATGENNSMFGQTGIKNPMFGKHHTEETKQKMSKDRMNICGKNNPHWKGGSKLAIARQNIKRRKLFGFIPHNIPHENFHGHHLDFNHVIFIPAELHTSISHSVINNKNMDLINNAVCDWYLEFQGV